MSRPLPVTLVTGFLGAGKTTLIRQLLTAPHGLQIGLVLNEIGQAGIDVVPEANRSYLELTEGCACCVANPDLVAAMQEIGARSDLDRVILETSGLADPLPLTWTLQRPDLAELVTLDAVVTVVDARNLALAGEEWESQVRCADLVVFTKADLVDAAQLERAQAKVAEVNPTARTLVAGPELPWQLVLDVEVESPRALGLEQRKARHSDFGGVIVAGPQRYELRALEDLLENLPGEIFRAKGIVPTDESEWVAFHVVAGRVQVDLDAPRPVHGEGRIALFGRRLDEARMRQMLGAVQLSQ